MTSRMRVLTTGAASRRGRRAAGRHRHSRHAGIRLAGLEPGGRASRLSTAAEPLSTQPQDLERLVRAGARWSTINSIVLRIANFLVGAALARTIFGPSAWGLYSITLIILAVLRTISELGVSAAIVRWQGNVRRFAPTIVTLSLIASCLSYVVLYAIAPYLTRALGMPGATGMMRVLFICMLLDPLCVAPLALLNRALALGRRMVVDCAAFTASVGVLLWLAYTGHGLMSYAWSGLAGCVAAIIVSSALAPYIVLPGWKTAEARRLLRFGLPLAAANLFHLAVFNVDNLIVVLMLGPAMLGFYQLAINISLAPVGIITLSVQQVSYAAFSRVADSGRSLTPGFTRALTLLMALAVPACILIATLARPLILAVYGERWTPAAHPLILMAFLGLMRVAFALIHNCIAAAGRRRTLMAIHAMWAAGVAAAVFGGARLGGITGAAAGHVVVAAALVVPASLWALARVGIAPGSVARACARPAAGGVLTALAALAVIRVVHGVAGLAAAIAAGGAVYLLVAYPTLALFRRSAGQTESDTLTDTEAATADDIASADLLELKKAAT